MLQDHPFKQGPNDRFLLFIKATDRLELQTEIVIGAAFVFTENEHIRTHLESGGEFADRVERGLRGACFVAAQLNDVPADTCGESGLGKAAVLAQPGQSLREIGGGDGAFARVPKVRRRCARLMRRVSRLSGERVAKFLSGTTRLTSNRETTERPPLGSV